MWCRILDKVKASAMTNLLMCEYVCGFLAALGRCLCGVSISYVNSFKLHIIISGSIKCSRSMCCLSYYSSAGGLNKLRLCKLVLMFRFLWISAGPIYSALSVNAKEVSGESVSDGSYCFIVVLWLWIPVVHVLAVILPVPNCTCWVFLLTHVFI